MTLEVVVLVLLKREELDLLASVARTFRVALLPLNLALRVLLIVSAEVLVDGVVRLVEREVELGICLRASACPGFTRRDVALTLLHYFLRRLLGLPFLLQREFALKLV